MYTNVMYFLLCVADVRWGAQIDSEEIDIEWCSMVLEKAEGHLGIYIRHSHWSGHHHQQQQQQQQRQHLARRWSL